MSVPLASTKKPFTFDGLVARLYAQMARLPDPRSGNNSVYSMQDVALGAFSIFFTQSPSFLSFQESMQLAKGYNNARSLFGITQIPSDNQIRNLLDPVPPKTVFPLFSDIFDGLNEVGCLDSYRSYQDDLLCALDGTQTFSSNKIHCEHCNTKTHRNGTMSYSHTLITPVIVAPGHARVISLEPEFITPQDGHDKQDCENTAAKRWLAQYGPGYAPHGIAILGDDLYCKQPICEAILQQKMNFILVCKPDSHKTLYEWVAGLERAQKVETVKVIRRKGKKQEIDTYRFVNQVPLRDGEEALMVNWCELTTTRADDKVIYRNAFATSHALSTDNVAEIVRDGRARWKVENENNNILKNRGYHLTHNFGHGQQYLSNLMVTFNLLAFSFHTVLAFIDDKYRLIRQTLPTRKTFFDDIRALTRYLYFESWDGLLQFMMKQLEIEAPDTG